MLPHLVTRRWLVQRPRIQSLSSSSSTPVTKEPTLEPQNTKLWIKILASMPIAVWLWQNVIGLAQVHGRSMEPTLNPPENMLKNDVVLLDKFSVNRLHLYKVGDVVILSHPRQPGLQLVKRILALPGDVVKPWVPPGIDKDPPTFKIPAGHVWVESDEPFHGHDSNSFGPIPLGLISARVAWILWPRFQSIPKERVGGPILGQTGSSPTPRIQIRSGGVWDGRKEDMRSGSGEDDLDELRILHFGQPDDRDEMERLTGSKKDWSE